MQQRRRKRGRYTSIYRYIIRDKHIYIYIHDRVYNRYEGEVLTDFEKDLGGRTDVRRQRMRRKEKGRAGSAAYMQR